MWWLSRNKVHGNFKIVKETIKLLVSIQVMNWGGWIYVESVDGDRPIAFFWGSATARIKGGWSKTKNLFSSGLKS